LRTAIEKVGASRESYSGQLKRAAAELNWERESESLKAFYSQL